MIAFTFPGQGSQRPGMGRAWADHESWELVGEASEAAGRDLEALLLDADAEELVSTENAQLATFVASLVVLDATERIGVEPAVVAGHSLGEYTALVASGAIAFDEGVRLVAERGAAMHVAARAPVGTMAAVLGLDDDKVDVACARVDGDVWVANYNAPGQVVIAGEPTALEAAGAAARELGAKRVMSIPVSGAFHTPFMAPARDRLRAALEATEIRDPEVPVYANVDALPHPGGDEWTGLLAAQLCTPVRWRHILSAMSDVGVRRYVELGPGAVLTGMAKRTVSDATTISVATPDDLDALLEALAAGPTTEVGHHEGEHLYATERLVVSPAAGVFEPDATLAVGTAIDPGDRLGSVGEHEVRSPFGGAVMGWLAVAGERVTPSQPIAWLRTV